MLPPGYSSPISRLSRDNSTLALVAAWAWVILYVCPVEESFSLGAIATAQALLSRGAHQPPAWMSQTADAQVSAPL